MSVPRSVLLLLAGMSAVVCLLLPVLGIDTTAPLIGTISYLEATWVLVNLTGVFYGVRNYIASSRDLGATLAAYHPDPVEIVVARAGRRVDRVILIKQLSYLFIGLLASVTPGPSNPHVVSLTQVTVPIVFLGGSLLLTYLGYAADADRANIRKLLTRNAWSWPTAPEKPQDRRQNGTGPNIQGSP